MALVQRAFAGLRSAVLANMRLPVAPMTHFLRGFADASYLDKNEVTDRVLNVVKNFDKVQPGKVGPTTKFAELGLDSLDTVELVMALEEEFAIEIPDSEADKILSCSEAISYIAAHPMAK